MAPPPASAIRPQIIVLKEGTDTSQGKPQLISNINACLAIVDTVRTTLGPRGMDKLIVDARGVTTISNDGATIMKLLDVVHPAARALVDIARAQDAEVGDGTTSVVVLAGEIMKQVKPFIEENVAPQVIIKALRSTCDLAIRRVNEVALCIQRDDAVKFRELLEKCAATSMNSKLIHSQRDFFKKMVVDAVLMLDEELNERLIGMKKIPGGGLQDSVLVDGVAFKKTFVYAGFEQQPKTFINPKVLSLNIELELKAERDNAEVRIERVQEYQAIVDAEWSIIYEKLNLIAATGANIVLSKLPIGDLAMQFFADRNIFCAGRVPTDDLERVVQAVGGSVQTSVNDLKPSHLGTCALFEEKQIGGQRFNFFTGCPQAKTCTLLLRGGSEQFIAEVERSLHDAIMIVRRACKNQSIVAGGGALEMELSRYLREHAKTIPGKQQLIVNAFARAFEVIPRQLCENAGFDATDILTLLRKEHAVRNALWTGVDLGADAGGVADNMFGTYVWEPALVKTNMISAATEATVMILSVDLSIKAARSYDPNAPSELAQMASGRGRGGMRRGMPGRAAMRR